MNGSAGLGVTVLQIIGGFWLARAVFAAAKLRLADHVGDAPVAIHQLAAKVGASPEPLRRIMRALATHGIFAEGGDGRYRRTPLSDVLRSGEPGSMRALAEVALGDEHYAAWGAIAHCLRDGNPAFDRVFGVPLWRYFAAHPQAEALFGEAMTGMTEMANEAVLAELPPDFTTVVDIGGGHGALMRAVLERHPGARGVLFDRPAVIDQVEESGLVETVGARLSLIRGDFFSSVPAGGDLYLLKLILHDWDTARAVAILRNVRAAIRPTGRLLIVEIVVPERGGPHIGTLLDLNMMIMTGGQERTEAEFRELLEHTGFMLAAVKPTACLFSVIEAVPV